MAVKHSPYPFTRANCSGQPVSPKLKSAHSQGLVLLTRLQHLNSRARLATPQIWLVEDSSIACASRPTREGGLIL
jgi:hypothetical protein